MSGLAGKIAMLKYVARNIAIAALLFSGVQIAVAQNLRTEIVPPISLSSSKPVYSPDGRLVAFAGGTGATLWDVEKRRLLRTFTGLDANSTAVAISPDGKRIASGAGSKVIIWDVESGEIQRSFELRLSILEAIVFTSDGRQIVYGGSPLSSNKTPAVFIQNADTGSVTKTQIVNGSVNALVRSKSGDQIAFGDSYGKISIIDSSGRTLRTIAAHGSRGSYASVQALAFSPDGSMLASGAYDKSDKSVKIWNVANGKLMKSLPGHDGNEGMIFSVSWSPDGRTLATTDLKTLRFWNVSSGALARSKAFTAAEGLTSVATVEYTPDDRLIYVDGSLRYLDDYRKAGQFGTSSYIELVNGFGNHASDVLIASNPLSVFKLNVVTGQLTRLYKSDSPDEAWTQIKATSDGRRIIGIEGNSLVHLSLDEPPKKMVLLSGLIDVYANAISPSGERIAVGTKGQVQIVDGRSQKLIHRIPGDADYSPTRLAFGPDGNVLLAELKYKGLSAIDTANGTTQKRIPFEHLGELRASGDGKYLGISDTGKFQYAGPGTGHRDYTIDVWRFDGLTRLKQMVLPSAAHIINEKLAFNADGTMLAAGGFESIVRLWDLRSGQVTKNFVGHTRVIDGMEFVANGTRLVSVGTDGLRIWNTATSELLASFNLLENDQWLTITPEGFFDASSRDAGQQISLVRGFESFSIDQVYQALYRPDLVREKLAGDPKGLVREAAAKLDLNKVIASGAAPRVSMQTPAANVTDDEVTVEASIAEQNGGGIGRIEWRVNGVTLGIESRGLQRLPEGTASSRPEITVKRALALEPGENRIEVVAYNGRDLIASDPAQIVLRWDGEKSATPPKLHVLAVGVNDYYDSRLKLSYAVPDARAIGDALKKAGAAMYQSVDVTWVLDDGVTTDNLDKVFAEVSRKVHPRDVFVFFLAGHGKTVDGRYHFLPQNFRYEDESSIVKRGIDQDRFQAWFAKIPARKSILLYDTCESGSLTGERVAQRGIERVAALEKMTRAMGRTVLSASSDDAPALEGYRGHGVFTYALLDGLQGADTNGNGLIEVTELAAFIDQQVPDLSFKAFKMRQIPQMKIVGNSFPVVTRTSVMDAVAADPAAKPVIPTRPTHVVISPTLVEVFAEANRAGAVVEKVGPGTTVTIVETANGWTLIAKDGKKLGFVDQNALAALN